MVNFLSTLAATLISVAATWFVAWWYYRRAGEDLGKEARELRRLATLTLTRLRDAGLIQANIDSDGRVMDFTVAPTRGQISFAELEVPSPTGSAKKEEGDGTAQPDPSRGRAARIPLTHESRSAMSRAKFFLERADAAPADARVEFEAFLEAAIVFARAALHRFQAKHERHVRWKQWWDGLRDDTSVRFFRTERDWLLKEAPPKFHQILFAGTASLSGAGSPAYQPTRAAEFYYFETPNIPATQTVARHLDALVELLTAGEELFN